MSTNGTLDVHQFPERIQCIAPFTMPNVRDIVRYSAVWRSIKRAYGARVAFDDLNAEHVMVTDPDGFAWRDLAAADIVRHSQEIWYSDHRGGSSHGPAGPMVNAERPPRPDTNARARAFCSLHPWAATRQSSEWADHAARMAIGRDWAAWEAAAADLMPAPDADLADEPLLVLDRGPFLRLWVRVEAHWHAGFADAILVALTTPSSLYKHCVRGDVFFLELSYRAWLFKHHRREGGEGSVGGGGGGSRLFSFRNSTQKLVESPLPRAAHPVGYAYRPSTLPLAVDRQWYHAGPSGLSRIWLHLGAQEALDSRAVAAVFEHPPAPRVAFRHDFSLLADAGANATFAAEHACRVINTVLQLQAPAAALQLASGPVPPGLWSRCAALQANGSRSTPVGPESGAAGPSGAEPYMRHRSEWMPGY